MCLFYLQMSNFIHNVPEPVRNWTDVASIGTILTQRSFGPTISAPAQCKLIKCLKMAIGVFK